MHHGIRAMGPLPLLQLLVALCWPYVAMGARWAGALPEASQGSVQSFGAHFLAPRGLQSPAAPLAMHSSHLGLQGSAVSPGIAAFVATWLGAGYNAGVSTQSLPVPVIVIILIGALLGICLFLVSLQLPHCFWHADATDKRPLSAGRPQAMLPNHPPRQTLRALLRRNASERASDALRPLPATAPALPYRSSFPSSHLGARTGPAASRFSPPGPEFRVDTSMPSTAPALAAALPTSAGELPQVQEASAATGVCSEDGSFPLTSRLIDSIVQDAAKARCDSGVQPES